MLSSIMTALAHYFKKNNKNLLFLYSSAAAVLLPALLAAFRDPGVGTDSATYCRRVWGIVNSYGKLETLMYMFNNDYFPEVEKIYLIFNWIVSLISNDIHVLFFFLNLLVVSLVYKAAYDNRDRAEMWQIMLFFYFAFYSNTLNLIRQYIAVAIGMYSFKYLENREWKKLSVCVVVMIMWHSTTIVYVALILMHLFLSINSKNVKKCVVVAIGYIIYQVFTYYDYILLSVVSRGIIPYRYKAYLTEYSGATFFDKSSTIVAIVIFLFYIILYCSMKENRKKIVTFMEYKAVATSLNCLSMISTFVFRMSYYFSIIADCIYLPRALYLLKQKNQRNYYIVSAFFVILFAMLWYLLYVKNGINETVPYRSLVLGIE